jgi:hypothetical protein
MAALDLEKREELIEQSEIIKDAQYIFQRLFAYPSKSFIAPSYIWHSSIEPALAENKIQLIQGVTYQYQPNPGGSWFKTKFRYTGKCSQSLVHSVRNAFFEPSLTQNQDDVEECLKRIQLSFQLKKPAIIGSHRVNYMGGVSENNRKVNLEKLKRLLHTIVKRWPDVEFATSDSLTFTSNGGVA